MADEQETQPVHATHLHSCGHCGSTAIQDQLEWPVGPLGAHRAFEVTCPSCGNTVEVAVDDDGKWVSDKLTHEGEANTA